MNKTVFLLITLVYFLLNGSSLLAQEYTTAIFSSNNIKGAKKEKSSSTFDSTFIFITDTLDLPFFDDFSNKRIQNYQADYSDVDITFDKVYKVLDDFNQPISNSLLYTTQETYRRTVDTDNVTYNDVVFTPTSLQWCNLGSYPVSYAAVQAYPPYFIYDSLGVLNDQPDTVWILNPEIYQDSATQFFKNIDNSTLLWLDSSAFHNYTYPVNPWSIGVMTFDGLDATGEPYQLGSSISGYADQLTSKPIDLTPYNASDSIYLSFLYQTGDYGESPDPSDSLLLHFYVKNTDTWENVWTKPGFSGDTNFRIAHIPVTNAKYFSDAFQFRFLNYGNLSGSFDHFHIDYVHLRRLSGYQDTLFKDFAWVYPITTLLENYTSVPWDHFVNKSDQSLSQNVKLVIRNGSNIAENNSLQGTLKIVYNGVTENSLTYSGAALSNGDLNYAPRTFYTSYHDFSSQQILVNNKSVTKVDFDITATIAAQFPNEEVNDTIHFNQYFGNYYSYDDGSAELAYGVIGTQSSLAIGFESYEADTLLGVAMNFVKTATDVSDKLFLLTIWDDNNGKPGNIVYQDDLFFPRSPQYVSGSNNNFYTYYFNDNIGVSVDTKFYVGWKQFDADRLNIGFDRNTKKNEQVFYSLNEGITWNQSVIEGVPMIRPVFSTGMNAELGVSLIENKQTFKVFPNPTNSQLNIAGDLSRYTKYSITNMNGQMILEGKLNEGLIDVSFIDEGIYFIALESNDDKVTHKFIKQ